MPTVEWVLWAFPRGVKRPERDADRLHLVQRLGMSGAVLTFCYMSSQHVQGQQYLYLCLCTVCEIDDLCVDRNNVGYNLMIF